LKRFLASLAAALLLVLGYAMFQRNQQRSPTTPDTAAEDGLALVCAAYDHTRTTPEAEPLAEDIQRLHQAADSLCGVFAAKMLRDAEPEVK
jgi:hypothetical protein